MNKEDLTNRVSFVQGDGHKELQLYGFVAKDDNPYHIKISETLEDELLGVIATGIQSLIIDKNYEIVDFSTADERKDRYYQFDLEEKPERMRCMSSVIGNHGIVDFDLSHRSITEINTLIIAVSDGMGHTFTVYKVLSSVEKMVKSSKMLLAKIGIGNDVLEEEPQPILKIGPKFQIIYTEENGVGTYVFLESSVVEAQFNLNQILDNQATRDIGIIQSTNLLSDVSKLQQFTQKTSFSKKLVGVIKSSKVIKENISKDRILRFIKNDDDLRQHLTISEKDGERYINITSVESAKRFLDLLNDEYVYSSLTEQKYQAIAKDER